MRRSRTLPRWTAVLAAVAACLLLSGPARAAGVTADPDTVYQTALDHYESGDYALAAAEFSKLLYPPPPGIDPERLRRAHLYRGISLFLVDNRAEADSEFYQV